MSSGKQGERVLAFSGPEKLEREDLSKSGVDCSQSDLKQPSSENEGGQNF